MPILEHEVRSVSNAGVTGLSRHLFSRPEYHRMAEAGVFDGQRVELIEGEVIQMAPIGFEHAAVTDPLGDLLKAAFGPGFAVRNQNPIALGGESRPSEPQPDIAVAVGTWRDYKSGHPKAQDIRLVVEVADSSIDGDRNTKTSLYASAGIPEYWIVNLADRTLEVRTEPANGMYRSTTIHQADSIVKPQFASGSVRVGDFMP